MVPGIVQDISGSGAVKGVLLKVFCKRLCNFLPPTPTLGSPELPGRATGDIDRYIHSVNTTFSSQ